MVDGFPKMMNDERGMMNEKIRKKNAELGTKYFSSIHHS